MKNFFGEAKILDVLLSKLGKRIYFPKGIVAQTESSSKARLKATAGVAFENGKVASLPETKEILAQSFEDMDSVLAYAPVAGIPELRDLWKIRMKEVNPSLNENFISRPIVTAGLTHGVCTALHLFLDENDYLLSPDTFWENYSHIVETVIGANMRTFPMYSSRNGFNLRGLTSELSTLLEENKKAVILLNFPNNPSGYSIRKEESNYLFEILYQFAERGLPILTIMDDAYFGLFYEDDIYQESLFAKISQLHERILAIKIDGATKELLSWGLRVGFITYGAKNLSHNDIEILQDKTVAYIRSTVTSGSRLSQTLTLEMLKKNTLAQSIESHKVLLKERYLKIKSLIEEKKAKYPEVRLVVAPFNSGYFLSILYDSEKEAEHMRKEILENENIALISIGNKLRIAFSCLDIEELEEVIEAVYKYSPKT